MSLNLKNKVRKWQKWRDDPVNFIESCIKVATPGGDVPIKLYAPQKKIVESFYRDHHLILLKSRQIGMSTICKLICVHATLFFDNVQIGILSRDGKEASKFCRDTIDYIEKIEEKWLIPKWMIHQAQQYKFDNGSGLTSSAISRTNPGAVFRGQSLSVLFLDECAFIEKIDEVWTSIAPALSKAQQDAKANNVPFGTVVLSTPNGMFGMGEWYYKRWCNANDDPDSLWTPHAIHWSEIEPFANDPEWIKTQHRQLQNDTRKIAQELEMKFISSDETLFDDETQLLLQDIAMNSPFENLKIKEAGELWKFAEIDRDRFYIIAIDCSKGTATDYTGMQVVDYITMEQVLEYRGKINPKKFINILRLVTMMCVKNIIIIENSGGYGDSLINDLLFEHTKYNIYHEMKIDKRVVQSKTAGARKNKKRIFVPGLNTNAKSRPLILEALYSTVINNLDVVKSRRLARELLTLVNKNGKVEAQSGFNDDLAMSFAFACYARKYGHNNLPLTQISEGEGSDTMINEMYEETLMMNEDNPIDAMIRHGNGIDMNELNARLMKHMKDNIDNYSKNDVMENSSIIKKLL